MFGIIGSGFGLYGHLPAIAALSKEPILIPARYLPVFLKRNELKRFESQIEWVKDEVSILERVNVLTSSVWPTGQTILVNKCLDKANIKQLILEKPLAATPETSITLLSQLLLSGKTFRINYSFFYTKWYLKINEVLKTSELLSININWCFMAHHYKHNISTWKRQTILGGGALRFYGIHLLAVLASLNLTEVILSETIGENGNDAAKWRAEFKSKDNAVCKLSVDSGSQEQEFNITVIYKEKTGLKQKLNINIPGPFSELSAKQEDLDPRIHIMEQLHQTLTQRNTDREYYHLYKSVNELWLKAEHVNTHNLVNKINDNQ